MMEPLSRHQVRSTPLSFLSIRLFAILYAVSVVLSAALIYALHGTHLFALKLPPEAAATLAMRIQLVRVAGLGFAVLMMLAVIVAASRAARAALTLRWLLGASLSFAFLRASGLAAPLPAEDSILIVCSATQLGVEALAILLLYGEDAEEWFKRS